LEKGIDMMDYLGFNNKSDQKMKEKPLLNALKPKKIMIDSDD
jgi:hypothetical protein